MNPLIIPIFGLLARQAVIFLVQFLVLRFGFPPYWAKRIDPAFGSLFGDLGVAWTFQSRSTQRSLDSYLSDSDHYPVLYFRLPEPGLSTPTPINSTLKSSSGRL